MYNQMCNSNSSNINFDAKKFRWWSNSRRKGVKGVSCQQKEISYQNKHFRWFRIYFFGFYGAVPCE
jgi:hypothetical protein